MLHAAQLGQVEFQPDHEHQKHHAKLSQVIHALGVTSQGQGMRAQHDACDQIAQHGRQLEQTKHHHRQHSSQQIQQGNVQGSHVTNRNGKRRPIHARAVTDMVR